MNKIEKVFDELRGEVRKLLGDPRATTVDHSAVGAAIDKAHAAVIEPDADPATSDPTEAPKSADTTAPSDSQTP